MKKHSTINNVCKMASLMPLMGLMKLGIRFGFGKQIAGVFLNRIGAPKVQAKAFGDYQPSEHDIFVTTFIKSGTNWMLQIAQQIACYGAAEFEHIHDIVPWPDAPVVSIIPLDDPGPRMQSPTGLRIIKTHNIADYVPYNEKAKYITVIRDPKETFVSSYYFLGGLLGILKNVTVSEWLDLFIKDRPDLGNLWAAHTAGFWAWRKRPNVLVITYNEMKKDPKLTIERVADLMDISLTKTQFGEIAKRSSFRYMKQHESQFRPYKMIFKKTANNVTMIRSGQSGKSDELITNDQQIAIDNFCRTCLLKIGSDFPYDNEFGSIPEF